MSIKDIILDAYTDRANVSRAEAADNMDRFSTKVAGVESTYGKNLTNSKSSARGIYQFLTKGDGNAFSTGLNRVMNAYNDAGQAAPSWVAAARKHGDPIKLTDSQQEEVMLANIYKQKTSNLAGMLEGNNASAMDLYLKHHHTDPSHTPTVGRAAEFFKPEETYVDNSGEVKDKPFGLGDIWDTITSPFDSGAFDTVKGEYTVKPNDNMYQIAKQNGMSLDDLISINPEIQDPSLINVGQKLRLGNGWFENLSNM
tara:strand:- start:194 stop:958 length:765 start_codon:yes stop_codon:yes gene_type:complete